MFSLGHLLWFSTFTFLILVHTIIYSCFCKFVVVIMNELVWAKSFLSLRFLFLLEQKNVSGKFLLTVPFDKLNWILCLKFQKAVTLLGASIALITYDTVSLCLILATDQGLVVLTSESYGTQQIKTRVIGDYIFWLKILPGVSILLFCK